MYRDHQMHKEPRQVTQESLENRDVVHEDVEVEDVVDDDLTSKMDIKPMYARTSKQVSRKNNSKNEDARSSVSLSGSEAGRENRDPNYAHR